MSGPFDALSTFGSLNRQDTTPNVHTQASDHNSFAAAIDALIAAGQTLQTLVMLGSNNLSELIDFGLAARRLALEHRMEGLTVPPFCTAYGHSYGSAFGVGGYVSSDRALFPQRFASRLGLPLFPPYFLNAHIPAQRIAATFGTMLSGNGSGWNWKTTSAGIVSIDAHRNDAGLFNTNGADTSSYQDQLRTCLRLLRMQGFTDDTALGSAGAWSRTSDATMASAGGQAFCSTGDVSTDYKSFVVTQSEHHVMVARFNQGVAVDGVLRIVDHTAGDAVLVDFSEYQNGFPTVGSGPSFAMHAIRLTGLTVGHELRMGRKPGTGGTVYVDSVLSPYMTDGGVGVALALVLKDGLLVNWYGNDQTVGYQNLWAAIDAVCLESEFKAYAFVADPASYSWDGRTYSATAETSSVGRNGCIGNDPSLIHPNDHGQLVYADALEAALGQAAWSQALGHLL